MQTEKSVFPYFKHVSKILLYPKHYHGKERKWQNDHDEKCYQLFLNKYQTKSCDFDDEGITFDLWVHGLLYDHIYSTL